MPSSEIESPEENIDSPDVSPELRREFLIQAGLLNLGILLTGVGLLLLGFTDSIGRGGILLGLGAVVLLATGYRYRRHAPP